MALCYSITWYVIKHRQDYHISLRILTPVNRCPYMYIVSILQYITVYYSYPFKPVYTSILKDIKLHMCIHAYIRVYTTFKTM